MRAKFAWVTNIVRECLINRNGSASTPPAFVTLAVETLEDRLALSATVPTVPVLHGINLAVPGDAFVLAPTPGSTNYTAMTKWPQPGGAGVPITITYSYSNLLDGKIGLSASTVKAVIQEALSEWATYAPLRFVEVPDTGPAPSKTDYFQGRSAMIRFGHLTIDGPGNTLAYGYYPGANGLAGDIIFDDSEHWSTNPSAGYDMLEVATHEIGHALGLAHEPAPSSGGLQAIMNPYYQSAYRGLGTGYLFSDDINGVRAIYGAGTGSVTPYSPPPSNPTPSGFGQNGFYLLGSTLYITGTAAADALVFDASASTPILTLNGIAYEGSLDAVRSIVFDGAGGNNTVSVTGSSSPETFALAPDTLTMTGPKWNFSARNSQSIVVNGGTGDQVTFTDSPGNDSFVASSTQAQMTGYGYSLTARGFSSVTANVVNGGIDRAWLYGSATSNYFVSTPTMAHLYGGGYSITTNNFSAVYAYSGSKTDVATLGGSTGNDTVTATPAYTRLQANNGSFTTIVSRFANVTVNGNGGNDLAVLTGSTGNDIVVTTPTQVHLFGANYSVTTNNMYRVTVASGGGIDKATLNAGSGDGFVSTPTWAYLYRPDGGYQFLTNFASVKVVGSANNTATLWGSTAGSTYIVMGNSTTISGVGFSVQVSAFNRVNLTSLSANDRISIYDAPGTNTLYAYGNVTAMVYSHSVVAMTGFHKVTALSVFGGTNTRKIWANSMTFDWWGNWF